MLCCYLLLSKTSWRVVPMKLKVKNLTFLIKTLWQTLRKLVSIWNRGANKYWHVYPRSLKVWSVWGETSILFLDPKWMSSKLIIKSTGLKMHSYELRYFNSQIHHRSNHLTLSERKYENLQSTENIILILT